MKRIFNPVFLSVALLLCSTGFTQSIFLRIDNIQGEATASGHENEINVLSYSNGLTSCNTVSSGTKPSGCKAMASSWVFMIQLDKSTIGLKNALTSAKIIPSADVTFVKNGGDIPFTYYRVRLENINVISMQESGASELPFFSVELSFSRIAWQYTVQSNTGGTGDKFSDGWDFAAAKTFNYNFQ
jgi:type VI secretion system secreted protein Hcp